MTAAHMTRAERAALLGDPLTCSSCGEALQAWQVPIAMHPTCARNAVRRVDMDGLSMRESLIYSAAYSEAIADQASLIEQVITAYAAALAQAEADADRYYHQAYCDCAKRTSRQLVHAIDVGERREQWRSKYGLNGAAA